MRKLVQAKANLQAVEEEMRKVEKICLDPGNEVKAFKTISRVSTSPCSGPPTKWRRGRERRR